MSERRTEDPALELLCEGDPHRTLTAAAKRRIWEGVMHAASTPRPRGAWKPTLAVACAAAILILWTRRPRPAPPIQQPPATEQVLVVPACGVGRWSDARLGYRTAVLGPGKVRFREGEVVLDAGRLVLTTTAASVGVTAGTRHVVVESRSLAEVTLLDGGRVRIAAFGGRVEVPSSTQAGLVQLEVGRTWEEERITESEPGTDVEAHQVSDGTTQESGLCEPPLRLTQAPPVVGEKRTAKPASHRPGPGGEDGEASLLGRAIHALRVEHDARAALTILESSSRGELDEETSLVRLEALQQLGDTDRVLGLLDAASLPNVARGWKLLALRADLRARKHRYEDAVTDYTTLLDASYNEEDAYIGRAGCRFELGQRVRARGDLEAYLERFPDGRHAAEARRALGGQP